MLISLLLTLTPESPATLPAELGRAVRAETLRRLALVDSRLAEAIHEGSGPKPLTCSSLVPMTGHGAGVDYLAVLPSRPYYIRLTGLVGPVSVALAASLLGRPVSR